jgi:hypothetical protein
MVLFISVLIVFLCVVIHYGTIFWMSSSLPLVTRIPRIRVALLVFVAILVHLLEIAIFAAGIIVLISLHEFGQLLSTTSTAFYYSAVTYTTLGFGDILPTEELRLFTAVEALTGLLLSAWTASAIYLNMQRYWPTEEA